MRIWYQTYSAMGSIDPRWSYYEPALERHIPKIARPDTQVDIHAVEKYAPKMLQSSYFQYLHIAQVIEKALQAEREGYDAFVLGGFRDFGYFELRETIDIPVVFMAEASFHVACLLAPKFSVISPGNEEASPQVAELTERYGLEERYVPGTSIGVSLYELLESFEKNPQGIIDMVSKSAKKVIEKGAGVLVPTFGGLSVFLAEHGVREVDGVPVLDAQAAVIKVAEMMVDFKRLGISRSKKLSKEEIIAARKLYGVE